MRRMAAVVIVCPAAAAIDVGNDLARTRGVVTGALNRVPSANGVGVVAHVGHQRFDELEAIATVDLMTGKYKHGDHARI